MKIALMALLIALASSTPQPARAAGDHYIIKGTVTQDHTTVAGANVRILCYYSGVEKVVQADAAGRYSLTVAPADCPLGTVVRASVGYDPNGNVTSYRAGITFGHMEQLTVADVKLVILGSVPEYDWIGATMALGLGGLGSIVIIRRYGAKVHIHE